MYFQTDFGVMRPTGLYLFYQTMHKLKVAIKIPKISIKCLLIILLHILLLQLYKQQHITHSDMQILFDNEFLPFEFSCHI